MTEPTTKTNYIRSIFQSDTEETQETKETTLTTLLLQWLESTSPATWEVSP